MTEEEFERNVGGFQEVVMMQCPLVWLLCVKCFSLYVNVAAWMFAFSRARHFEDSTEVAFYGLISKWAFPPVITTYFVL